VSGGKSDKKKQREKKRRQWMARATALSSERFREETRSLLASAGKEMTFGEASGPKLSARILKLAEPYLGIVRTEQSLRTLIAAAALAWNIAIQPEEEHREAIEHALSKLGNLDAETIEDGRVTLSGLIGRKLDLSPDDRRLVLNYQVDLAPGGILFHVVSTKLPEKS